MDTSTIDTLLACTCSRGAENGALPTVAFQVKDGNIMPFQSMALPSLNANNKPNWMACFTRGFAAIIHPELCEQEEGGPKMTRQGVIKNVGGQFGELGSGNQFMLERPSGANPIDAGSAAQPRDC